MALALSSEAFDRHLVAELIDRQMWFFGCDIRHPSGNLLVAAGFRRDRPPAEVANGTSRYALDAPSARLVLWGWGVLWMPTHSPAVLLRRHGTGPRLLRHPPEVNDLWQYTQADRLPSAHDADATVTGLTSFARWVGTWERHVRQHCGEAWRRQCAADRSRHVRRRFEVDDVDYVATWDRLAAVAGADCNAHPGAPSDR
jgi:hypothetical protein